jgi:hypothetical protein
MKTLFLFLFASLFLSSCTDAGVTRTHLDGTEENLPDELKGLKVYRVSTGGGDYVKVAILNSEVNSLTYRDGKHDETTIIVNGSAKSREIYGEIISETDSIIVIHKN